MKNSLGFIIVLLFVASLLGGCEGVRKEDQGAIAGGVLGAIVGSKVGKGRGRKAAIIVGAIAGTAIGSKIGRHYDEHDRERTAVMLENNNIGESSSWRNPDTGYEYTAAPTRTYYAETGDPCREFTMDVVIGGRMEKAYGTACRQRDGSWKIIR